MVVVIEGDRPGGARKRLHLEHLGDLVLVVEVIFAGDFALVPGIPVAPEDGEVEAAVFLVVFGVEFIAGHAGVSVGHAGCPGQVNKGVLPLEIPADGVVVPSSSLLVGA